MYNRPVHVAVIDDGVNEKKFLTGPLLKSIEINEALHIVQPLTSPPEESHGTLCGAIIKRYAPQASLVSIKILNTDCVCNPDQLVTALEWCCENRIRIVNLSLGSIDYRDFSKIAASVNRIVKKGVIIIAAFSNQNIYTYPASLSNVIGVKADVEDHLNEGEFYYHLCPYDGIEITAVANHRLIDTYGFSRTLFSTNSFAAPLITALVFNFINSNPSMDLPAIRKNLFQRCVNHSLPFRHPGLFRRPDWVEKAVVFNLPGDNDRKIPGHKYCFQILGYHQLHACGNRQRWQRILEIVDKEKDQIKRSDAVVVIDTDRKSDDTDSAPSSFFEEMNRRGINLVYMSDYYRKNELDSIETDNIKIWHPLVYHFFRPAYTQPIVMDIPSIVVLDFTAKRLVPVISGLSRLFRRDGYFAVPLTDTVLGVLYGLEYFSTGSPEENHDDFLLKDLFNLYRLNNPDLFLVGIQVSPGCGGPWRSLRSTIDILILIADDWDDRVQTALKQIDMEHVIFITSSTDINMTGSDKIGISFFPLPPSMKKLYSYIIKLFKRANGNDGNVAS